jgi:hypothetical protein
MNETHHHAAPQHHATPPLPERVRDPVCFAARQKWSTLAHQK